MDTSTKELELTFQFVSGYYSLQSDLMHRIRDGVERYFLIEDKSWYFSKKVFEDEKTESLVLGDIVFENEENKPIQFNFSDYNDPESMIEKIESMVTDQMDKGEEVIIHLIHRL